LVASGLTKAQCEEYIKTNHPTANGATIGITGTGTGNCFAEYGLTNNNPESDFGTSPYDKCMFGPSNPTAIQFDDYVVELDPKPFSPEPVITKAHDSNVIYNEI
jgi:hypothetical protein